MNNALKCFLMLFMLFLVSCGESETTQSTPPLEDNPSIALAPTSLRYNREIFTFFKDVSVPRTVVSINGERPIKFSIVPSLPEGLILDENTGQISGASSILSEQSNNYIVTATNKYGSISVNLKISVLKTPPQNLSYELGSEVWTVDQDTLLFEASVDNSVDSFSISPALPQGLVLSPSTGQITGSPQVVLPLTRYTVTASNSSGDSTYSFDLKVNDIAPSNLNYDNNNFVFRIGQPISDISYSHDGGAIEYFLIEPQSLPPGIFFNIETGKFVGTPLEEVFPAREYTITAFNTGGQSSRNVTINVLTEPPESVTYSIPNRLRLNEAVQFFPTVTGRRASSFRVTPSLPSGLRLDSETGEFSGSPTEVISDTTFTFIAANSGGEVSTQVTFFVADDPPTNVAYPETSYQIRQNADFDISISQAEGGAIVSYEISPNLPAGLSLDTTTGRISGSPIEISNQTYTVNAINSGGRYSFDLTLEIIPAPAYDFNVVLKKKEDISVAIDYIFELTNKSRDYSSLALIDENRFSSSLNNLQATQGSVTYSSLFGGSVLLENNANVAEASLPITTIVGRTYSLHFEVKSITDTMQVVYPEGQLAVSSVGDYSFSWTSSAVNNSVSFFLNSIGNVNIDNILVYEERPGDPIDLAMPINTFTNDPNIVFDSTSTCFNISQLIYDAKCEIRLSYVNTDPLPSSSFFEVRASNVLTKTINLQELFDISPKNVLLAVEKLLLRVIKNLTEKVVDTTSLATNGVGSGNVNLSNKDEVSAILSSSNSIRNIDDSYRPVFRDLDNDGVDGIFYEEYINTTTPLLLTAEVDLFSPVCEPVIPYENTNCSLGEYFINTSHLLNYGTYQVSLSVAEGLESEKTLSNNVNTYVYAFDKIISGPRVNDLIVYKDNLYFPANVDNPTLTKLVRYNPNTNTLEQVANIYNAQNDIVFPVFVQDDHLYLKLYNNVSGFTNYFIYDDVSDSIRALISSTNVTSVDRGTNINSDLPRVTTTIRTFERVNGRFVVVFKDRSYFQAEYLGNRGLFYIDNNNLVELVGHASGNSSNHFKIEDMLLFSPNIVVQAHIDDGIQGNKLFIYDDSSNTLEQASDFNPSGSDNIKKIFLLENSLYLIYTNSNNNDVLVQYTTAGFNILMEKNKIELSQVEGQSSVYLMVDDGVENHVVRFTGTTFSYYYTSSGELSFIKNYNSNEIYILEKMGVSYRIYSFNNLVFELLARSEDVAFDENVSIIEYDNALFFSCLNDLCMIKNNQLFKVANDINIELFKNNAVLLNDQLFISLDDGLYRLCKWANNQCL